jgi:hypothetical protein
MELAAEYEPGSQHFRVAIRLDENGLITCTVVHLETQKPYIAAFGHQNSLGGPEKLAQKWAELRPLFRPAAVGEPEAAAAAPVALAPDTTVLGAAAAAAAGVAFVPPPPGSADAPDIGFMPPPPAPAPAVELAATTPAPAPPSPLVEIAVEVPAQFQGIVRRAKKEVLRQPNSNLIEIFNAFATALNSSQPIDQVEELGDDLENAYQDARRGIS